MKHLVQVSFQEAIFLTVAGVPLFDVILVAFIWEILTKS